MSKKRFFTIFIPALLIGIVAICGLAWSCRYAIADMMMAFTPFNKSAIDSSAIHLKKDNGTIQLIANNRIFAIINQGDIFTKRSTMSINGGEWGAWVYYDSKGDFECMELVNLNNHCTILKMDSSYNVYYGAIECNAKYYNPESYRDIGTDGIFDIKTDNISSKSYIWLNKQWMPAELIESKDVLYASLEQKDKMVFKLDKWIEDSSD